MSSCQLCKNNQDFLFYCRKCPLNTDLCPKCIYSHHHTHIDQICVYCEECEDQDSQIYCPSCEQYLCKTCDSKIHNKGKRARHIREELNLIKSFQVQKIIFINNSDYNLLVKSEQDLDMLLGYTGRNCKQENQMYILDYNENDINKEDLNTYIQYIEDLNDNINIELLKEKMVNKFGINQVILITNINEEEKNNKIYNIMKMYQQSFDYVKIEEIMLQCQQLATKKSQGSSGSNEENQKKLKNSQEFNNNKIKHLQQKQIINQQNVKIKNNNLENILSDLYKEKIDYEDNDDDFGTQNNYKKSDSEFDMNTGQILQKQQNPSYDKERQNRSSTSSNNKGKSKSLIMTKNSFGQINYKLNNGFNENIDDKSSQKIETPNLNDLNTFDIQTKSQPQAQQLNQILPQQQQQQQQQNINSQNNSMQQIQGNKTQDSINKSQQENGQIQQISKKKRNDLEFQKGNMHFSCQQKINQNVNLVSFPVEQNSSQSNQQSQQQQNQNTHNIHKSSMPFPVYQNQQCKNPNDVLNNNSFQLYKELQHFAEKGFLLIERSDFIQHYISIYDIDQEETDKTLTLAEQMGIIHKIIRIFDNNTQYNLISMNLEYLSLQSLIWIIKSIIKDRMTPTEKLILSRIKECFALKMTPSSWEMIINHIEHPNYVKNSNLPQLIVKKNQQDPLIGTETTVIYFFDDEFNQLPEDCGKVDENSSEWKQFLDFINNFFSPTNNTSQKSKTNTEEKSENSVNELDKQQNQSEIANTSQEIRVMPGGRYGCAQYVKYCGSDNLRQQSLGKLSLFVQEAINKGIIRYQKTLLVKNVIKEDCDSSNMQDWQNNSSMFTQENSLPNVERSGYKLQREAKIKYLQDALIEVLIENSSGIALAQVPQYLKKKVYFQFNLQELGFQKLSNFIATVSEVKLEVAGTVNSFAVLKNPQKYQNNINLLKNLSFNNNNMNPNVQEFVPSQGLSQSLLINSNNNEISAMHQKQQQSAKNQNNTQNLQNQQQQYYFQSQNNIQNDKLQQNQINAQQLQQQKFQQGQNNPYFTKMPGSNPTISPQNLNVNGSVNPEFQDFMLDQLEDSVIKKTVLKEEIDRYLQKVINTILQCLKENPNPNGIRIDNLFERLNKKLGFNFEYSMFNCMNFNGFLTNFCEHILDIEYKKSTLFIYEKNQKFGQKNNNNTSTNSTMMKNSQSQSQNQSQMQQIYQQLQQYMQQQQNTDSNQQQNIKKSHIRNKTGTPLKNNYGFQQQLNNDDTNLSLQLQPNNQVPVKLNNMQVSQSASNLTNIKNSQNQQQQMLWQQKLSQTPTNMKNTQFQQQYQQYQQQQQQFQQQQLQQFQQQQKFKNQQQQNQFLQQQQQYQQYMTNNKQQGLSGGKQQKLTQQQMKQFMQGMFNNTNNSNNQQYQNIQSLNPQYLQSIPQQNTESILDQQDQSRTSRSVSQSDYEVHDQSIPISMIHSRTESKIKNQQFNDQESMVTVYDLMAEFQKNGQNNISYQNTTNQTFEYELEKSECIGQNAKHNSKYLSEDFDLSTHNFSNNIKQQKQSVMPVIEQIPNQNQISSSANNFMVNGNIPGGNISQFNQNNNNINNVNQHFNLNYNNNNNNINYVNNLTNSNKQVNFSSNNNNNGSNVNINNNNNFSNI